MRLQQGGSDRRQPSQPSFESAEKKLEYFPEPPHVSKLNLKPIKPQMSLLITAVVFLKFSYNDMIRSHLECYVSLSQLNIQQFKSGSSP